MRTFPASEAFRAFATMVITESEKLITPGGYTPAIPSFPDPEEATFTQTMLVPLIAEIHQARRAVTPSYLLALMDEGRTLEEAQRYAEWLASQL